MPRVLIVEDDPATARAIAEELEGRGFSVQVVATGADAIDLARSHPPDVLLCSWLLEGDIGGEEVARRLHAEHPSMTIVFISGLPTESFTPRIRDLPVRGMLGKPVSLDDITQAVEDAARSGST